MKLPATLSKQYCRNSLDMDLRCNFEQSCKKEYSSSPLGFTDADASKILFFVESMRGLRWTPSV